MLRNVGNRVARVCKWLAARAQPPFSPLVFCEGPWEEEENSPFSLAAASECYFVSVSAQASFGGGRRQWLHTILYLAVLLLSPEHSRAIQEPTANAGPLLQGTESRHLSFFPAAENCSASGGTHKVEARFGFSDKAPCSGSFWVRSYFSLPPSPTPSWVLLWLDETGGLLTCQTSPLQGKFPQALQWTHTHQLPWLSPVSSPLDLDAVNTSLGVGVGCQLLPFCCVYLQ